MYLYQPTSANWNGWQLHTARIWYYKISFLVFCQLRRPMVAVGSNPWTMKQEDAWYGVCGHGKTCSDSASGVIVELLWWRQITFSTPSAKKWITVARIHRQETGSKCAEIMWPHPPPPGQNKQRSLAYYFHVLISQMTKEKGFPDDRLLTFMW